MRIPWKSLREASPKWLKAAALVVAGMAALYAGAFYPLRRARGIAQQRATGLAAIRPVSFYDRLVFRGSSVDKAVVGGVPGVTQEFQLATMADSGSPPSISPNAIAPDDSSRRIVRTDSLDLLVQRPADAAESIRQLASRLGGFLVTSEVSGDPDLPSATLTIRVPAARFEEARAEIRKLGLRIESERVEAQDVTRQYVDQAAHLRTLRAEEEQYLAILKRAATVKDTLEVSEKLSEVRGAIEQQQAEFEALSKQTETVAITVSLRAETDTQVFGLHWRPLYQLKVALREGLNGLADFAATMASVILYLPAVLLWMGTVLLGLALAYRILRWAAPRVFPRPPLAATKS